MMGSEVDSTLNGTGEGREGGVEICFNNTYGGICDTFWDDKDALVVCSQLGFSTNGIILCGICCNS